MTLPALHSTDSLLYAALDWHQERASAMTVDIRPSWHQRAHMSTIGFSAM